LPLDAWPEADRQAWAAALAPGDVLDAGAAAAGWRPPSRRNAIQAWGHYLTWLARTGQLAPDKGLAQRVTPERLVGYVGALRARGNAPDTVLHRLDTLDLFLHAADPQAERGGPKRLLLRLRAEAGGAGRRGKRLRLQASHDLFALGCRLMARAAAEPQALPRQRAAVAYRNGLIIALLAARPLRLRNFVALELGRHLVRTGQGWRIVVPGPETKTGRPLELPFPEVLVPMLERYLAVHRPALAQRAPDGAGGQALWLSAVGRPLHAATLAFHVAALTRAAFGRPVNVHLFRDCAAISLAIEDPAHVRIAAEMLGHSSLATTERHYNLARGQEAATRWHQMLEKMRG
jgi:integrase